MVLSRSNFEKDYSTIKGWKVTDKAILSGKIMSRKESKKANNITVQDGFFDTGNSVSEQYSHAGSHLSSPRLVSPTKTPKRRTTFKIKDLDYKAAIINMKHVLSQGSMRNVDENVNYLNAE